MQLLFVRYAPGACGNFLIALLQSSNQVSHWHLTVENAKKTSDFKKQYIKWFESCFTHDLDNHLKHEPHHPYKLDFISAKHPRGDDLSVDEFINELKIRNDQSFLESIQNNCYTVLRLNKIKVPLYGYGSTIINIILDEQSLPIFYKLRQKKLFGKEENLWIKKEEHPEYLKHKYYKIQFNNPYKFDIDDSTFYNQVVVDKPYTEQFESVDTITNDVSNLECKQIFVNLNDLLSSQVFDIVEDVFRQLNLGIPDKELIEQCYQRYYQTNIQPFLHEI
jgi:hypothetical protein